MQALFQINVWVDEADGFNAFWGLRQGRKKMGRVANSVRSLLPAFWPFKAALRLLSRVAVIDLLQPLADRLACLREQLTRSQPDEPAFDREPQASDPQAESVLCPTCGQVMHKQQIIPPNERKPPRVAFT